MGFFSSPKKPNYPERPTFNLGAYQETLQDKLRSDISIAEAPRAGLEQKLRGMGNVAQKSQEASLARRGIMNSGISGRWLLNRQSRMRQGFSGINEGIGKRRSAAQSRIGDAMTGAAQFDQDLRNTYETQFALVKQARKDISRASKLRRGLGALTAISSIALAPATGGLSLATGAMKLARSQSGGGFKGRGPQGIQLPEAFRGQPKYENKWQERLDPFTRPYWGGDYFDRFIAPQRR